jgi:hypothetical protein
VHAVTEKQRPEPKLGGAIRSNRFVGTQSELPPVPSERAPFEQE